MLPARFLACVPLLLLAAGCAPEAGFTADPTSGAAPLEVTFQDQSNVTILGIDFSFYFPIESWAWDLGDGTQSAVASPTHTYDSPGQYPVSLTVTNALGTDSVRREAFIMVAGDPPAANFTADPSAGNVPLEVAFTDTSTSGSSPIVQWQWDFGDGGGSAVQNPVHTYTDPGTYSVSLTVTTASGSNTRTREDLITVRRVPPTAEFQADEPRGNAPHTVNFTDFSTPGSAPITDWVWYFGDGGTSTGQNPRHVYTTPGTYTVSLTVSNVIGEDTRTKEDVIVVSEAPVPPVAEFQVAGPASGAAPLTVQFSNFSTRGSGASIDFAWDFGDGNTSTDIAPQHTYTAAGVYTVSLRGKHQCRHRHAHEGRPGHRDGPLSGA